MDELLLRSSGWNYSDAADNGGWTGVFYPHKNTKRLRYYSQFFNTAEMDSTFYDKFYSQMTKGTFIGMAKATPETFQFSIPVNDFENIEQFLDRLPPANGHDSAMEFRHPSWGTEGTWEMLKHYNIAAVMTDSLMRENLQFLSDVIVTANHSFIRFHGRNLKGHYWCNYLYSEQGHVKDHCLKLQSKEPEIEYFGLRHNLDTVAACLATLMTPL